MTAPHSQSDRRAANFEEVGGGDIGGSWVFANSELCFVEVAGTQIAYRHWDRAAQGASSLLFLHGARAHSHWWDHIVPYFWDDYRVAVVDFSGMGDSGWRDRYTMRGFADEVLAVIQAANLGRVTIVAHSFGGTPGSLAGHIAPDQVSRLIVIDSRMLMSGVPEPVSSELIVLAASKRGYATLDHLLSRYRLMPSAGHVQAEILRHVAVNSAKREYGEWTWKFDPKFNPMMVDDPCRLIAPPQVHVDFIVGEKSAVVSPEMADRIVSIFPDVTGPIVIPRSDHHVLLEQPLALVSVMRTLLA